VEPTSRFIYLQQTINGLRYKLSLADESNYKLEKSLENEKQRNVILKDLNNDFAVRYKAIVKDNEQSDLEAKAIECENCMKELQYQKVSFEI